ncbi:hypothetical protein P7H25_06930 [Paenibacillus larvae]|nr:hypothetical protein [Paenibacillus larvae]
MQAAKDLFGDNSNEAKSVNKAYDAVGSVIAKNSNNKRSRWSNFANVIFFMDDIGPQLTGSHREKMLRSWWENQRFQ